MAAALVVTPAEVQVGDAVKITGTGFLPMTEVEVTIPEYGEFFETMADQAGAFSSSGPVTQAFTTLTSDAVNVAAAETVTIGAVTYTFRAAVGVTANEVKVGADAATSLANLKAAINADPAGSGVTYGSATVVHPTVAASAITATTLFMYAKVGGVAGNALASTETSAHLSFTAATFAGGVADPDISPLVFTPTGNTPFTVKATDGTNSATASVKVFSE